MNSQPIRLTSKGSRCAKALSIIGSIFASLTVGFCPLCIPAVGAFLSAIGLGFLVRGSSEKFLIIGFLFIALFGFFWSYLKEHRNIWPLILGVIFAVGLYVSRYFDISINGPVEVVSIAGLVATSIWNILLKRRNSCVTCECEGQIQKP